jgi:hypothetical protein
MTESKDVVALGRINRQHVVTGCKLQRLNIFFRQQMVQERIQNQAKLVAMKLARLDVVQEQRCTSQLVVSPCITQLALSTIRNEPPS